MRYIKLIPLKKKGFFWKVLADVGIKTEDFTKDGSQNPKRFLKRKKNAPK